MRKSLFVVLAISVVAIAIGVAGVTTASAGEITGNGKDLVVKGKSICAYSGLNDLVSEEEPLRTQNFGEIMRFRSQLPPEFAAAVAPGGPFHPGNACNPNIGVPEEE